ncbi:hypothetical protein QNR63_002035 [Escherichia coli]|nr:hypothetical protein [Escherichia coli]
MAKKPGENTGKNGGIYQEVGPRGGKKDNFATVKDNERLPPTTKPGHGGYWISELQTAKSNNQAGSLRLFDMSLAELNKPAH